MWCYDGNKYINKALAYKLHLNQQIIVRDDKYRNKTLICSKLFWISFFAQDPGDVDPCECERALHGSPWTENAMFYSV